MQTVFETRRARLRLLRQRFPTTAALNLALGWEPTNARMSQILNASIRSDRGTPFEMGDVTARYIEQKIELPLGWMDTPLDYIDSAPDPLIAHVLRVMEAMPEWQRDQAAKIIDTLVQPAANDTLKTRHPRPGK